MGFDVDWIQWYVCVFVDHARVQQHDSIELRPTLNEDYMHSLTWHLHLATISARS